MESPITKPGGIASPDRAYLSDLSKITKGGGITFIGTVLGRGVFFLYTVFLARFFGADVLGLYFLGYTVIAIASSLSGLGLNVSTTRYVAIYNGREDLRNMRLIVLVSVAGAALSGAAAAAIVCLAADYGGRVFFHKPELGLVFQILACAIPFETVMRVALGATQGLKLMRYTAIAENFLWIGGRFLFTIVLIPLLGWKVQTAAWAYVGASALASMVSIVFAVKCLHAAGRARGAIAQGQDRPAAGALRLNDPGHLFRKMLEGSSLLTMSLKFSVPFILSSFLGDMSRQIDFLLIGSYMSNSDAGVYGAAVRLILLAEFSFQVFDPIFRPFVSELHDKGEYTKLSKLLKTVTRWNVSLSLPIFMMLVLFPSFFLGLFGTKFYEAAVCLSILAIAHVISSPSILPSSMIFMTGRSDITLKNNILLLILNATLNILLIPRFGIVGAAASAGIGFVVISMVRMLEVYRLMNIHIFSKALWKPGIATLFALAPLLIIGLSRTQNQFMVLVTIVAFLAVYGVVLFFTKGSAEDRYIVDLFKRNVMSQLQGLGFSKSGS